MKKLLLVAVLLGNVSGASAFETTDYHCLNQCTNSGGLYSRCRAQCTTNSMPTTSASTTSLKSIDFQCVQDCQKAGGQYAYCTNKCSY